jgi:glutathione S-transferase
LSKLSPSWSLRSWLLLKEAGIEFEEYRIALDVPDSAAEIARFSPSGRVPVLMLGEQPVWDTLAIAEAVAERWPEKELWIFDIA